MDVCVLLDDDYLFFHLNFVIILHIVPIKDRNTFFFFNLNTIILWFVDFLISGKLIYIEIEEKRKTHENID